MSTSEASGKDAEKDGVESAQGPSVIELGANAGIAEIKTLHTTLVAALEKKTDIVLHSSKIDTPDTALLQLLSALAIQARKSDLEVRWESPSESIMSAARLLDLDQHMNLPSG